MIEKSSDKGRELVTLPKLTNSKKARFGQITTFEPALELTIPDDIKKRETVDRLLVAELDLARREMKVHTFEGFRKAA